jgi:hypothetical protein
MKSTESIKQELTELNSSLVPFNGLHVFSVPEGYFENFAASVLARLNSGTSSVQDELKEISPLLAGISRKMPFSLPEGYFNNLEADQLVNEEELPAVLRIVDKDMPFAVPYGYFDSLADNILSAVKPEAKVIRMNRNSWMRMAVAAVATGLILISSIFYFNRGNGSSVNSQAWFKTELKNVSDEDLDKFIKNADAVHENEQLAKSSIRTNEVRSMLTDVSVNEMEDFLEQVPNDDDELSVIN